ncbi:MAG TPA: phosphotransferase [Nitrolancea sp.]
MPEIGSPIAIDRAASLNRLTEQTAITFLCEKGLLDPRAIVDGQLTVQRVSRRNLSFRITTTLGQNFFVKHGLGDERATSVAREAAILRAVDAAPHTDRLRRFLPRVRDWDEERQILVFDLVPEARSLVEHYRQTGRWSLALARQAATALRLLHSWQPDSAVVDVGDGRPPGILSIHRPDRALLSRMTGGSLEIIKIIQASPQIVTGFDELRDAWSPSALIHGDIKWDNVVVLPTESNDSARLQLVDWEMARLGDPLWDVGSYLSQYLDRWIMSIPAAGNSALAQARAAGVPLPRLQPAMQHFWERYTDGVGLDRGNRAVALERVVRYAAARLVQTAIEGEYQSAVLSNTGVLRLQVAQNMLQRPTVAATSLLGLDRDG